MALLAELGIDTNDTATLLVSVPDYVLPELAGLKPRPSFASSLQVAEPARRIVWWPSRQFLTTPMISRLRWMLETAGGEAWLLYDPEDPETVTPGEILETMASVRMASAREVALGNGDVALQFRAVNAR